MIEIKHDTDISIGARKTKHNCKTGKWIGRILDWDKLLSLILKNNYNNVEIGLAEDWFWTGSTLIDNQCIRADLTQPWIYSCWATPVAICDDEVIPIWKLAHQQKYGNKVPDNFIKTLLDYNFEIDFDLVDKYNWEEINPIYKKYYLKHLMKETDKKLQQIQQNIDDITQIIINEE